MAEAELRGAVALGIRWMLYVMKGPVATSWSRAAMHHHLQGTPGPDRQVCSFTLMRMCCLHTHRCRYLAGQRDAVMSKR